MVCACFPDPAAAGGANATRSGVIVNASVCVSEDMECTLRQILQTHFEGYAKQHRLPAYVHRAAYWIGHRRTAELGGHVGRCPEGPVERAFYNSCHQRGCPQCQALATERWLERQRA